MLPLLALACATAPSDAEAAAATLHAPGEVREYVEDEGRFQPVATQAIRALTSLDAHGEGDELWLSGLSHALVPSRLAEWFPQLFVVALASADGLAWTAHSFPVDAPGHSLIDPALTTGPEGRELWFVQVEGTGDPAEGSRPSTLVRTRWTGTGFGRAEAVFTGAGLVDPSPVVTGNSWEVFLTHDHHEVVRLAPGATTTEVVATGLTVPHARREGTVVVLTAQSIVAGKAVPVELRREDGGRWSAARPLLPADAPSCASPSTAVLHGVRRLFCSDDRPMGGKGP